MGLSQLALFYEVKVQTEHEWIASTAPHEADSLIHLLFIFYKFEHTPSDFGTIAKFGNSEKKEQVAAVSCRVQRIR